MMVNPAQKIFEADSESLYDFVSKNGRGLYIPPYQRDYAWDKANVERLIDDTVQGLNALLKRPEESITFIGTIITMNDAKKITISPLVKNQVYGQVMTVIDGQQRLATLLMLCLALLLEIEIQWAKLNKSKVTISNETKDWVGTRVNNMRGLLSQMLTERQNNGSGEFRYFPKMIRSFIDTWSYEADKAVYQSPIAWLLFEYVKFHLKTDPNWSEFSKQLKKSSEGEDNEAERKHFIKMLDVMRKKFKRLPAEDDFPNLLEISRNSSYQETLFGEEFPLPMREALESVLGKQPYGIMVDDAGEIDLQVDDVKAKAWWKTATELVSLLFFAQFALERITLVVVTAVTEDFAFDVFEALNTTGQPLTAIETFTPKVVQAVGLANYNSSEEKKLIETAFAYLKKVTRAEERQKRSAELLVAFALAEKGEKRSKNLADQRRFMREKFDECTNREEQQQFIRHLADLSKFFDLVWVDDREKPRIGKQFLDDQIALCIRFLVELGHTITVPLLAQYAAEVDAAKDTEERNRALDEFSCVTKAVTAFTVFWRSSRTTTDRIDQVYRDLMSKGSPEHDIPALARGLRGDKPLPKARLIQHVLAARLKSKRPDGGADIGSEQEWIDKVVMQPLYDINTALARFVLLVAFHDVVEGTDGQIIGKIGTHSTLTFDAWVGDKYFSVEHIAPQTRGKGWSEDLYKEYEYERLGNLTLLPMAANQSLSNLPWDLKRVLFGALAARTKEESDRIISELQKSSNPEAPKISKSIYSGHFLPHVHVLNSVHGGWDLAAVEKRGRELAKLVWHNLAPWLGLDSK